MSGYSGVDLLCLTHSCCLVPPRPLILHARAVRYNVASEMPICAGGDSRSPKEEPLNICALHLASRGVCRISCIHSLDQFTFCGQAARTLESSFDTALRTGTGSAAETARRTLA